MSTATATITRSPVQFAATVVGVVFLLVGVLGFVPGVTTQLDALAVAGHGSGAMLLGLFHVSVLHNLVHLLFGVAGLALARTSGAAYGYLVGGGAIYLLLAIYGAFVPADSAANVVPVNTADNWLHLVLAAGMVGLGLALGRSRTADRPAGERR